ncbi:MAG: hypothetical protein R3A80_03085 [Bdellovibrionota bacterium]
MTQMQSDVLNKIRNTAKKRFADEQRLFSFEDFTLQAAREPRRYLRNSIDWVCDAFDHFGPTESGGAAIFKQHYGDRFQPVFGQHEVQKKIWQLLEGFSQTGRADKVFVLHGPNGSAKTTLCRNLFAGLENFSKTNEGALYTFSWVFPLQKLGKSIGLAHAVANQMDSYALWPTEDLGAILRSELHENPLLLIPKQDRLEILESWKKELSLSDRDYEYLRSRYENAELSHKNTLIFETLLSEYQGDLLQVYRHVRVERFYLSYQLRSGLAVIEPQFGIDAHVRQVTLDQSLSNLPPSLQSLNLYQFEGDLVAGNRGVVEFSDLLKRPLESFKYLLSTSENSRMQVGPYASDLDTLFIATTNDHQLEAFREHPEFISFRGRFEFIRVPYLLKFSDELQVYDREIKKLKEAKEVLPHTAAVLALWAVMSRLKKPMTKNKTILMSKVLESLDPLEKAKAYDTGEVPERLTGEEKREFRSHLAELKSEHQSQPFYEGLLGPSARELRILIQRAALNSENKTLGPLSIIRELRAHVLRRSDFEYLRLEPVGAYHDYPQLIELAYKEWMSMVDGEIRSVLSMGQLPKIREMIQEYVQKVMILSRGEKIKNRITGKSEEPSATEIEASEKLFGVTEKVEEFRQNILGRLGAWSVENKRTLSGELPFDTIFPDLVHKVRNSMRAEEDTKLAKMSEVFAQQSISELSENRDPESSDLSEGERLAILAYRGLQSEKAYGPLGALEAIGEYVRYRFRVEKKT